ncbi:alpha/beta-hydrolase [Aspergillus sclerotioniger CBS 115572]|uniref:Alpha/beta-hydrolase n=1 Tax=Aspergillus sclerotioniger CBS 115572 TaxID=1450535 RepID=A0A317WZ70_9EURO|nr:alpha/beta-hydrolase [Aspergillus sclerotioniger CBS 115572]PWY91643.1 alpha/beta-hydrolase [Aspergillus sclerotioniger CBS 115572]
MKLPTTLLLSTILHTMSTTAQNLSYGADNFYRSDTVTLQPITFKNQYQMTIAGNLFTPKNLTSTSAPSPAIVIGHPMGAVKEQSANLYATKLAEQGFITISLDLPFWGSSSGTPRNAVSPDLYAEAFSAAVDYLGTQSLVNRDRIGAIGICGSGSFVISAAKIDPRIKAIATASMYNMGAVNRNGLNYSQTLSERQSIIADAAQHRWIEIQNASLTEYTSGTPNQLTPNTSAVGREFYDFYRTSRGEFTPAGSTPELTTHPTLTSNLKFMNFYPFNDIESIAPRPLLFISGDRAHSREFSEDAFRRAAEPKELVWIPGAGHVDLYDRVELIPFERLTSFFRVNLGGVEGGNGTAAV